MGKIKKAFFCQICGTQHTQWQGQCNGCKDWNTIVEEIISKETNELWKKDITPTKTLPIQINVLGHVAPIFVRANVFRAGPCQDFQR